jgi:hypothetical protein
MNYKELVNNANKYHYYITSQTKIIQLSSANNKSEAKRLALEKLKPNIDNLIGKKIVLIRIKSIESQYNNKNTVLNVIGGPIVLKIERGLIKSKSKIQNYEEGGNTLIYLSEKYIKKNKLNLTKDLNKIIKDYILEKLNLGLLNLNIL